MTLIAFTTKRDSADIVTDTGNYPGTGAYLSQASKIMVLPHLDLALLAQGNTEFGYQWRHRLSGINQVGVHDFDALHAVTPTELRDLWESVSQQLAAHNDAHGSDSQLVSSVVFHVGYSPAAGRFKAYAYPSDDDFEPVDVSDGHVMPAPIGVRPSSVELRQLSDGMAGYCAGDAEQLAEADAMLDRLAAQPPMTPPSNRKEWAQLVRRIRTTRALAPYLSGIKTPVSGDVFLTTLRRGELTQRRLLTFDDTGDELLALVAGTLHPLSQYASCVWCDSGQPFIDCCLTELADAPCPCRSGRTFDICHSVRAGQPATEPALTGATA